MIRIGHGFDVHPFTQGRPLRLGGVEVPYDRGLAGHSDADVLIHAVSDACLGAAGKGDIGRHFPDTDDAFKDIDSRELLRRVAELLFEARWRISNVDSTIVAQAPRLAPYLAQMESHMAADLGVATEQVNVKATTTERLGYLGREEGIAAHAVVLLSQA